MFQTTLISYRSHQLFVPLTVSKAVAKPVVHVDEGVTLHASHLEVPDQKADHNGVKGATGIEEKNIHWIAMKVEILLDSFSDEQCSKLMAAPFTLILGGGLSIIPEVDEEIMDVHIKTLSNHRAGRNCSVISI